MKVNVNVYYNALNFLRLDSTAGARPNCACAIDHKHEHDEMAVSSYSQYSEYTPPAPEGELLSFSQYWVVSMSVMAPV